MQGLAVGLRAPSGSRLLGHHVPTLRRSVSVRPLFVLTPLLLVARRSSPLESRDSSMYVQSVVFAQLGALVMYRRSQAGGGGHYKTIVRSPDGWRSYDGMESGGVGVRIRSPEGDHLPRAGHWFPVEVVYERVPG